MEKMLVLVDGHRPGLSSINFACSLALTTGSKLTGLVVENTVESVATDIPRYGYFGETELRSAAGSVQTDTGQAIRIFEDQCARNNVSCDVVMTLAEPIRKIINESRFADLLVMDPGISLFGNEEALPSFFLREILAGAECPVFLSPEEPAQAEEIIFCYDGSASSVFAIKQFTYLLPQLSARNVLLLEVNSSGVAEFNEGHRSMMSWLKAHYGHVYYSELKGQANDALFNYFFMKQKKIIVMGAFGRGLISQFFRKSTAEMIVRHIDLPIFIAHH